MNYERWRLIKAGKESLAEKLNGFQKRKEMEWALIFFQKITMAKI